MLYFSPLEIDGCKWKIQCEANHCVGRTSDGHYDGLSVHQFSGAFIRLKTIGIKECVRIFGIILYQWVVNGAKVSRYRFIGSRMIAPDTVHRSYLPYDVVTHQRIGRKIDICFIDDDELLGPAIFVPLVESRVDWGTESKQDLLGEGTHLFYMLDPMRFSFPKSRDFDSTFYTNLSADSELQRPNESRPVFFTMEALKRWQVELGLESVEPRHEMLDDTEIASWFDTN